MSAYDDRLADLIAQERGARAERQGFLDARSFPEWTKPVAFTKDAAEQRRYNIGWEDGKALLKIGQSEEITL